MSQEGQDVDALGRAVRTRRQRIGITQQAVAERGGPSGRTLRAIESGAALNVTSGTLAKLDHVLFWDPGTASQVYRGELAPQQAVVARQVAFSVYQVEVADDFEAFLLQTEFDRPVFAGDKLTFMAPEEAERARAAIARAKKGREVTNELASELRVPSADVGKPSPNTQVVQAAGSTSRRRAGNPSVQARNDHDRLARFRASQPLAEALAELQDIDDPSRSEQTAIDLVWTALSIVMGEKSTHNADTVAALVSGFKFARGSEEVRRREEEDEEEQDG